LTNCNITGNTAGSIGGGIYNTSSSSPTFINCLISGNHAGGGGGMQNENSSLSLTNCTISGNSAETGGGISTSSTSFSSTIIINNSIIWGNTATTGNQFYFWYDFGTTTLNYSCYAAGTGDVFYKNTAALTPINCINNDPQFINPANDFRIAKASP
jgi:parallel beta-helix repeat protein